MTYSGIDEWPHHGGGVQLVNIIGKAVGLWKSKGDKFNPVYRAKSKSLSAESRLLTSCSYPPKMYIALARTQAEWPSLAPGTVPEILGMNHLWVSVSMKHLTISCERRKGGKNFIRATWGFAMHYFVLRMDDCNPWKCIFLMSHSHKHLSTSCISRTLWNTIQPV